MAIPLTTATGRSKSRLSLDSSMLLTIRSLYTSTHIIRQILSRIYVVSSRSEAVWASALVHVRGCRRCRHKCSEPRWKMRSGHTVALVNRIRTQLALQCFHVHPTHGISLIPEHDAGGEVAAHMSGKRWLSTRQ